MLEILPTIVVLLLAGCTTTRYVPITSVHTDSIYVNQTQVDSVWERDSIFIMVKGDTIVRHDHKLKYVYRFRKDTVSIERVDTIRIPYPVEKQLSKWEQAKLQAGGIAIGTAGIFLLAIIIYVVIKFKRK